MKLKFILSSVLVVGSVYTFAQKKPLDHSVYDGWQSIGSRKISNDGKWVGYSVDPQEGNSKLYLSSPKSKSSLEFPRGVNCLSPVILNLLYSPSSLSLKILRL